MYAFINIIKKKTTQNAVITRGKFKYREIGAKYFVSYVITILPHTVIGTVLDLEQALP